MIYDNNTDASENSDVSSKTEQKEGGRERGFRSGLIKDFADKMTGNRDRGGSGSRVSRFSTIRHFHPRHEPRKCRPLSGSVSAVAMKPSAAQSSRTFSVPLKKRKKGSRGKIRRVQTILKLKSTPMRTGFRCEEARIERRKGRKGTKGGLDFTSTMRFTGRRGRFQRI